MLSFIPGEGPPPGGSQPNIVMTSEELAKFIDAAVQRAVANQMPHVLSNQQDKERQKGEP